MTIRQFQLTMALLDDDPNGPWCYTTDRNKRYDYCHVPHCNDQQSKEKVPLVTCLPDDDLKGQNFRGP